MAERDQIDKNERELLPRPRQRRRILWILIVVLVVLAIALALWVRTYTPGVLSR